MIDSYRNSRNYLYAEQSNKGGYDQLKERVYRTDVSDNPTLSYKFKETREYKGDIK